MLFTNHYAENDIPLYNLDCVNTIVTGYADDVVMGVKSDTTTSFNYNFDHCLLRTVKSGDSTRFVGVIWEEPSDTATSSTKNFKTIDTDLLRYDFRLSERSKAIGNANKIRTIGYDRLGIKRDDEPDMGCYEYVGS